MMPSRPERQSLRAPLRDATLRRSYLIRVFGLIWTAARGWTVAWGILLVVQGLMPVALVYLAKPLVDGLQAAVGRGTSWETVRPVLLVIVGIGSVLLLTELLKVCLEWIGTAQSELVQDHITDLVHAKSTAVDLAFYETPVALVYLTKPLVDGLQAAVGRGTSWETVRPVLLVIVGIGSVLLLTELLKVCLEWIGTAQSELV